MAGFSRRTTRRSLSLALGRMNDFFHIVAPSFTTVLGWRLQQEETNLGIAAGTLPLERMEWVSQFILHYERITRRMLAGNRMPGRSVFIDEKREVIGHFDGHPPVVVFSDLDGTLLDHETYSYAAALPALGALRQCGGALVLASSKTAVEIRELRAQMGFGHCPAIVENGGGLLPPENELEGDLSQTSFVHADLMSRLNGLPADLRTKFEGFSDWSVEEVAARTGLSLEAAKLAAQRAFTEPGIWNGTAEELQAFKAALAERGLFARQGGRFISLSFGATKADQMARVLESYRTRSGDVPVTIALGDAPNDVEMIESADHGVIINNAHGGGIPSLSGESDGRIHRTRENGPLGWNHAILNLLNGLDGTDNHDAPIT